MAAGQGLDPGSFINPSLPLYVMAPVILPQDRAARAGTAPRIDCPTPPRRSRSRRPRRRRRRLPAGSRRAPHSPRTRPRPAPSPGCDARASSTSRTSPHPKRGSSSARPRPCLLPCATWRTAARLCALGLDPRADGVHEVHRRRPGLVPVLAAVLLRTGGAPGPRDRWALLSLGAALLASLGILLLLPTGSRPGREPSARRRPPAPCRRVPGASSPVSGARRSRQASGSWCPGPGAVHPRTRERVSFFACARDCPGGSRRPSSGFFVGTPYAALEPRRFLSDLAFDDQTRFEYKGLTGDSTSFGAYLGLAAEATTTPLLLTALLGLAVAAGRVRRGSRATLVVVLAAVAPYLLLSTGGHRAMRFVAPMLPPLAWLAALALRSIASTRSRASRPRCLSLPAQPSPRCSFLRLFLVDSRILAERWMAADIPTGTDRGPHRQPRRICAPVPAWPHAPRRADAVAGDGATREVRGGRLTLSCRRPRSGSS